MGVLCVDSLNLTVDGFTILDNISFEIKDGITALCGPNGSGKTCLLKVIKGLMKQSGGSIVLDGKNVSSNTGYRLLHVGLVFQEADFQLVGETVEKDIMFGPLNLGWGREKAQKATEEVLETLGMTEYRSRRPQILSGGEKRCLAIAGVLVMKPSLILLDEPFANLDLLSVRAVLRAVLALKEAGVPVVIVSHEIDRFLVYAGTTLVLDSGSLVFSGKTDTALDALKTHNVYVPRLPLEQMTWMQV